jgi:hypothetical protein
MMGRMMEIMSVLNIRGQIGREILGSLGDKQNHLASGRFWL